MTLLLFLHSFFIIQTATPSGTVRTRWGFLLLFCKAFLFCCHGTDSACSHGRSDATEKKGQCCANRGDNEKNRSVTASCKRQSSS